MQITRNRVAVRHVGSNPTRSATEHQIMVLFFFANIPSKSRYICPKIAFNYLHGVNTPLATNYLYYRLIIVGYFYQSLDI